MRAIFLVRLIGAQGNHEMLSQLHGHFLCSYKFFVREIFALVKRRRQKIVWLKPWNPSNKTLEPQNLSVAIKFILSLLYSSWLLSTYARSRNQIVQYTLRYYCNSTLLRKHLYTCYIIDYDGLGVSLKSREMCFSHGILSRIDNFFFCHK